MTFGYIRVSSIDQNEGRQLEKMKELGIQERFIYIDKASGKDFDRPNYIAMVDRLREGDTVYIDSLDRLGRNYDGVIAEWRRITREIGADIIVLDNPMFNTKSSRERGIDGQAIEDILLSVIAYVAELERRKIRSRQSEGIALAKAEGRYIGRPLTNPPPEDWVDIMKQWERGEISTTQALALTGFSSSTFYKRAKSLNLSPPIRKRGTPYGTSFKDRK